MRGDHGGVLLLAAEPAARLLLDHDCADSVERERPLERLLDVVRALHRPVDLDATVPPWEGDDRVVLDVELLLVAGPVFAFDDDVGGRESRVQIAAPDVVVGEHPLTHEWIEDRLERRGPQGDPRAGLGERGAIGRSQEAHRFRVMADLAAERDERRLVVLDQATRFSPGMSAAVTTMTSTSRTPGRDRSRPAWRAARSTGWSRRTRRPGTPGRRCTSPRRSTSRDPRGGVAPTVARDRARPRPRARAAVPARRCARRRPDGHATRVMAACRPGPSTTDRPRCPRRRRAPDGSPRIGRSRGRRPCRE